MGKAQFNAPIPTIQSKQADVIASFGTPLIVMPKNNDVALWFYPKIIFAMNSNGEVVEVATKRLINQLSNTIQANPKQIVQWALQQPHLDFTDPIIAEELNSDQQYSLFISFIQGKDTAFFNDFVRTQGDAILQSTNNPIFDSPGLRSGILDALNCRGIQQLNSLCASTVNRSSYTMGVKTVADDYKKYLTPVYTAFVESKLKRIPNLVGNTLTEAVTLLTRENLKVDVVNYRNPRANGSVTEICPKVGSVVKNGALVILYVGVE
jgi:hypothetical protein